MGVYRRVDRHSDLVEAHNKIVDRDAGNNAKDATQIRWLHYDGNEIDPHDRGAVLSANNPTLLLRNPAGKHRRTYLSTVTITPGATPPAATPANCVELVDDDGFSIGVGKYLRLYDAAGVDHADLTSDADGGLVITGSGANAGDLLASGNLAWKSGTTKEIILDHAATLDRVVTFQDLAGTVALLGSANAGGNLLFVDNTYDIGAAGATRPRNLFLAGAATIDGGQIVFPAVQVPSAGANTLDDYEEGTWTPTLNGATTTTYTTQTGIYIKVGRLVTVWCDLLINSRGDGSQSTIAGLPFASDGNYAGVVSVWTTLAVAVTGLWVETNAAATMFLRGLTAAAGTSGTVLGFQNSAFIRATLTYRTAN